MYSILRIFLFSGFLVFSLAFALVAGQPYEGDKCRLASGAPGVCKKLWECPVRLAEVREGRRSSEPSGRCGFDNFVEIVCCPLNLTGVVRPRAAEVACEQYYNNILNDNMDAEDGLPARKGSLKAGLYISSGTWAQSKDFPHMVALGYENSDANDATSIKYSCGGSLISDQHVLTAAHCVRNINERVPIEVRMGAEDLRTNSPSVQRIPISEIVRHPRHSLGIYYNDLAILKLSRRVQFNTKVKPICLQTQSLESLDMTTNGVIVLGWGKTRFDGVGSPRLMRTPSLSLVERNTCTKFYENALGLPNGVDENMLCVTDRNASRQADACQGDSGGPLLMLSESGNTIVGITAFGQYCGGIIPGVYMAIHPYLDWIEQQVWEEGGTSEPEPDVYDADNSHGGVECRLTSGAPGVYKQWPDCRTSFAEISTQCGSDIFFGIVCCPMNYTEIVKLRAAEVANGLISGDYGDFPYMAALGYENSGADGAPTAAAIWYRCGGTLISDQHVLTAAHCARDTDAPVEVRLGIVDLSTNSPTDQRIPVSEIVRHPQYDPTNYYNNLAILKLSRIVQFSNNVKPIRFQTKSLTGLSMIVNSTLARTSWVPAEDKKLVLVKLKRRPVLSLMEGVTCGGSVVSSAYQLPDGLQNNMRCTERSWEMGKVLRDRDGPLVMLSESGETLVGFTSFTWGFPDTICDVYTMIHPYLDWIKQQVWGEGGFRYSHLL